MKMDGALSKSREELAGLCVARTFIHSVKGLPPALAGASSARRRIKRAQKGLDSRVCTSRGKQRGVSAGRGRGPHCPLDGLVAAHSRKRAVLNARSAESRESKRDALTAEKKRGRR